MADKRQEWLDRMEAERRADRLAWDEYDSAADWCARMGHSGKAGDPLPPILSVRTAERIDDDPDAFEAHVRQCAYRRAMERVGL